METDNIVAEEQVIPEQETADMPEEQNEVQDAESEENELETLRQEVKRLTEELRVRTEETQRAAAQIGEFGELFPDVAMEAIPDSVWESVRKGSTLAAAYALYARKAYMNEQKVGGVNKKNALNSAGPAGRGAASEYFTPDEVRAMSQKEVRANYSKIIESMKKWN